MFISPTEATRQFRVSKPTLYADMKSGKISHKKDARGKRRLDIAELERVYDRNTDDTQKDNESPNVKNGNAETFSDMANNGSQVEIKYLKDTVQQQQDQIEHLKESLKLSQEGHNRATLLLEDRSSGAGSWEKEIKAMEQRISNQIEKQKEESNQRIRNIKLLAKKKIDEANAKLEAERNKNRGFFQKLFG